MEISGFPACVLRLHKPFNPLCHVCAPSVKRVAPHPDVTLPSKDVEIPVAVKVRVSDEADTGIASFGSLHVELPERRGLSVGPNGEDKDVPVAVFPVRPRDAHPPEDTERSAVVGVDDKGEVSLPSDRPEEFALSVFLKVAVEDDRGI